MTAMRNTWTLAFREIEAYFLSPVAYVVIFLFSISNGAMLCFYAGQFTGHPRQVALMFDSFFGFSLFWILPLSPLLTMRLLAEEKRTGTIEVLMTAPVTETQVVLGKFLAAEFFYALIWLSLSPLLAVVGVLALGPVDWGPVVATYAGILALGLLTNAVGIFASALSRNQLVAAVVALSGNLAFFLVSLGQLLFPEDMGIRRIFQYASFASHFGADYSTGVIDLRYFVFYGSFAAFFLFLTVRVMETRKWK